MIMVKDISTGSFVSSKVSSLKANALWLNVGLTDAGRGIKVLGKTKTAHRLAATFDFWPHQNREERDQYQILLDVDGWGW